MIRTLCEHVLNATVCYDFVTHVTSSLSLTQQLFSDFTLLTCDATCEKHILHLNLLLEPNLYPRAELLETNRSIYIYIALGPLLLKWWTTQLMTLYLAELVTRSSFPRVDLGRGSCLMTVVHSSSPRVDLGRERCSVLTLVWLLPG